MYVCMYYSQKVKEHCLVLHSLCNTWCRRHVTWTRRQWLHVMFTDESRFRLAIEPHSTMCRATWNGQRYRDEILRPLVVPALQQIGQQAVLQDDNTRPHRARVVNTFSQQAGVNRMDWPACSPDLNPIENLWDHLEQRVVRNHPPAQTLQQLLAQLQLEWQAIPQHQLRRLTNSMRRRCAGCIANRGGHTHY